MSCIDSLSEVDLSQLIFFMLEKAGSNWSKPLENPSKLQKNQDSSNSMNGEILIFVVENVVFEEGFHHVLRSRCIGVGMTIQIPEYLFRHSNLLFFLPSWESFQNDLRLELPSNFHRHNPLDAWDSWQCLTPFFNICPTIPTDNARPFLHKTSSCQLCKCCCAFPNIPLKSSHLSNRKNYFAFNFVLYLFW